MQRYLSKREEVFLEIGNTQKEFSILKNDSQKYIVKIHGSFNNPETFIITKSDYDRIMESAEYQYWRDKIFSILNMCPLIMIGYSAKDPDFQAELKRAKMIASPEKPVYMFIDGMRPEEIEKLRLEYNIKVFSYPNTDGNHSNLTKKLLYLDAFIPNRGSNLVGRTERQLEESQLATALFIYDETVFKDNSLVIKALKNCILYLLNKEKESLSISELTSKIETQKISFDQRNIESACKELNDDGYVEEQDCKLIILQKGKELLDSTILLNKSKKDRFIAYCELFLTRDECTRAEIEKIVSLVDDGLNVLFSKRGLEIARKIIGEEESNIQLTFDVATAFKNKGASLSADEYEHYIKLILAILQTPSDEVKEYLAILCNSCFMYHILGHDEEARNRRLQFFATNKIIIDSNVMLPLLACNCEVHNYAKELFKILFGVNKQLYITENILQEIISHAKWAIKYLGSSKIDNIGILHAGMGTFGYRQNLFAQGGLSWLVENGCNHFSSYLEFCLGANYKQDEKLKEYIIEKINSYNIKVLSENEFSRTDEYNRKFEDFFKSIAERRNENGTYTNELQCKTEANLLLFSNNESFTFLTTTTILKQFDKSKQIRHCHPESVYRFLMLNKKEVSLTNLYECMVSELYNCGFSVISKKLINELAPHYIQPAELNLNETLKEQDKKITDIFSKELLKNSKETLEVPYLTSQYLRELKEGIQAQSKKLRKDETMLEQKLKKVQLAEMERNKYEKLKNQKALSSL